jgi:hypothetical protein
MAALGHADAYERCGRDSHHLFYRSHAPEAVLEFPQHLRYTVSHEWAAQEPNGDILVGISALAQDSLGELVYVELPALGRSLSAGEACAVVESTKAAGSFAFDLPQVQTCLRY